MPLIDAQPLSAPWTITYLHRYACTGTHRWLGHSPPAPVCTLTSRQPCSLLVPTTAASRSVGRPLLQQVHEFVIVTDEMRSLGKGCLHDVVHACIAEPLQLRPQHVNAAVLCRRMQAKTFVKGIHICCERLGRTTNCVVLMALETFNRDRATSSPHHAFVNSVWCSTLADQVRPAMTSLTARGPVSGPWCFQVLQCPCLCGATP